MGPAKASKVLLEQIKDLDVTHIEVTLFGSLAATGKGHLTDWIILETLKEYEVKVHWKPLVELNRHPNAMKFDVFTDEENMLTLTAYSVGGGIVEFEGVELDETKEVYPHQHFDEVKEYCLNEGITLLDYVYKFEDDDFKDYLKFVWETMNKSIDQGLSTHGTLPGDLKVSRRAQKLFTSKVPNEPHPVTENRLLSAFAFAVSETNASGGLVVTAPTCGASGVLPAVLKYMQYKHGFSDERIIDALAVAGIIGNVIKHNASISGAEAGCQAEVGSATSMAAAAHAHLFNLTTNQIEYAAEVAMEHQLGLTCDPIKGYVQIPCIERNAVAAIKAVTSCGLAYFLTDTSKLSFDTVVKTMYETGIDMHRKYRETSEGGLALHHNIKH
jgi:L-serine dehydratase